VLHVSPKRKGEILSSLCKPPMLGIHILMYIAEVFTEIDLFQILLLFQNLSRHLNFIVLIYGPQAISFSLDFLSRSQ